MNLKRSGRGMRLRDVARAWVLLLLLLAGGAAAASRDLVLVLDNSGSMRGNDGDFLIRAAVGGFVDRLPDGDRVAIVIFDHAVRLVVPLTELDADTRGGMLESLEQIDYRGRLTDSPAAIERAVYELKTGGRPGAQQAIVFLTDGIVDTGDSERDREATAWLRRELADDAARHGIRVFGLAFTGDADLQLIQSVAVRTGGDYFRAPTAADLSPAMQHIADAVLAAAPEPAATDAVPVESAETAPVADGVDVQEVAAEEAAGMNTPAEESLATERDVSLQPPAASPPVASVPAPAPMGEAPPVRPGFSIPSPPVDRLLDRLTIAVSVLAGAVVLLVLYLMFARRQSRLAGAAAEVPQAVPVRAFLDDLDGVTQQLRHELTGNRVTVGRGLHGDTVGGRHIQIPRDTISRLHGSIEAGPGGYWVVDNGSINGVFVNGVRVQGKRRLAGGDRLRFHEFEFAFRLGDQEEEEDRTVLAATVMRPPAAVPPAGGKAAEAHPPGMESDSKQGERMDATVLLKRPQAAVAPRTAAASGMEKTVILRPGATGEKGVPSGAAATPPPADGSPRETGAGSDRTVRLPAQGEGNLDRTVVLRPRQKQAMDKTVVLKPAGRKDRED